MKRFVQVAGVLSSRNIALGLFIAGISLISAMALTGCSSTPRGLAHKAYRPVAERVLVKQDLATAQFAREVSLMGDGQSSYFASSPLGSELTVTARPFYLSGLGEKCRQAAAAGAVSSSDGVTQIFAVCEQSDGSWRYVAPLTAPYSGEAY